MKKLSVIISLAGVLSLSVVSGASAETFGFEFPSMQAQTSDTNVPAAATPATGTGSDTAKSAVRYSLLFGTIPVTFLFGVKAWDWSGDHDFYSHKEGWYGQGTSFGGGDKAGHFFAHYMVQRGLYNVFDWTESGGSMKWAYSAGLTMAVGLFIEVGDGFSSQYGFSYEDLINDYTGILCGVLLDRFPLLDGFFGISTYWYPTEAYRSKFHEKSVFKSSLEFVNDYSGWKTMLNFKFAGFENLGIKVPLALRLIQLDIGYYTRGFGYYDKGKYASEKRRVVFYGVSVNSAEVLKESWDESSRGGLYKASHTFLEYYHLPLGYEKANTLAK
jgi:hypothetical protein